MGRQAVRARYLSAIWVAAFILVACADTRVPAEPPHVTMTELHRVEWTLLEQRYALTLRVQNPNPVPLPITGMEFRINLDDTEFARGVSREPVTVPAYGEELLDVVVSSNMVGVIDRLRRRRDSRDRLRYELIGHASVSGLPARVRFFYRGEFGASR